MRPARAAFKSIETRYRLFLSESILGSTYVMSSIPLKVSSSIPKPSRDPDRVSPWEEVKRGVSVAECRLLAE